jgi:hypothetical protein
LEIVFIHSDFCFNLYFLFVHVVGENSNNGGNSDFCFNIYFLFVHVVGENSNNGGKLLYIRQFIRPCCWRKLQQRREIVVYPSVYSSVLLEKTPTTAGISVSLFVRVVGENSNNGGNIRQFIRPCCWRKLQQRQEKMFYKYIILF